MQQKIVDYFRKAKYFVADHSLTLSICVFLVLLGGLFLTVYQVSQQQEARSRAQAGLIPHVNCSMSKEQADQDTGERKLFSLVNEYRRDNGLDELVDDEVLNRSAAWLAKDMADKGKLSHTDSLGRNAGERVVDCGFYGDEGQVLENIAKGQATPEEVFDGWKKSQAHNAAMLNEDMIFGGVGRRLDTSTKPSKAKDCTNDNKKCNVTFDTYYWVMNLTAQPDIEGGEGDEEECYFYEDDTASASTDDALIAAKNKNDKKESKKNTNNKGGKNKNSDKNDKKDDKKKKKKKKKKDNDDKSGEVDVDDDEGEELEEGDDDLPPCDGVEEDSNDTDEDEISDEDDVDEEIDEDVDENDDGTTGDDEGDEEEEPQITEPLAPSLQFAVNIPGSEDLGDIRELIVDFTDLNNKVVATETVEIQGFSGETYIGFLEYGSLPTGVYKIRVKLPNSLRKALQPEYQRIDVTQDIDLPEVTLVMGDFDNNNILNILDFNIFKNCMDVAFAEEIVEDADTEAFAKPVRVLAASCSQHDETDLNGDGIVDLLDYNILLHNFQNARGN
jgi:hypothetical protein